MDSRGELLEFARHASPLVRFGGLVLALSLVAVACTATSIAPGVSGASGAVAGPPGPTGRLTMGMGSEIESPHPYLASQIVGISARMNMFDNLVDYDHDGKLVPGLAESWVVDGLSIRFKLRQGVRFHNGEAFNAEAVKFSLEHLRDPSLRSPAVSNLAAVREFKVIDPATVEMILSRVDARIFDVLANDFSMVPPLYIQSVGIAGFISKPVGTGPFKFVEWVKDDHLLMEANESYWAGGYKGKPAVRSLSFRPLVTAAARVAELRAGGVDWIQDVPPDQVESLRAAGITVLSGKTPIVQHIYFNTTSAAGAKLQDARVRLAMNYGVDMNLIIRTVLRGYARPLSGGITEQTMGYNSDVKPFTQDQAKARSLLAEAGLSSGLDLDMDITTSAKSDLAEAVIGQLAQIGIRVKLNPLPSAVYNDRWVKKQMSPLYFSTWNTFTDPGLLDLLAGCKGFLSSFCSQEAQRYLDEGGATLDQAKRAVAYRNAVAAFARDPFAIFLGSSDVIAGMSARVVGWRAHSVGYLIATGMQVK